MFDNESMMGTRKSGSSKGSHGYSEDMGEQNYSNESFVSNGDMSYEIPDNECNKLREVLDHRCDRNNLNRTTSPRKNNCRKTSESTESSIDKELAQLNREMEGIQMECQEMVNNQSQTIGQKDSVKSEREVNKTPRSVPRMGTRIDKGKTGVSPGPESPDTFGRRDTPSTPKMGQTRFSKGLDKDGSVSTSAYNTGESCRSTPLTLELNPASDEGDRGFKNSMLCLATTGTTTTPPLPSHSDTEKQTQTPAPAPRSSRESSSDENYMTIADVGVSNVNNHKNVNNNNKKNDNVKVQMNSGESLQDLYMQYADVMYTNHANLEHTMQIQQKLFQQQIDQRTSHRRKQSSSPASRNGSNTPIYQTPSNSSKKQVEQQTPPDSGQGQMEWVVKRRPDGTRYITRRPVRSKMLKERAKKISEERCGMTTDDDAMSELKTGRYWTKEEKKRHVEKARDYKKRREMMARAKMETVKETDEKKDIVELSHRKMMKHKGKRVLDDFTTVQEMLAHGNKAADGKTYSPLLSVTTV